MTRPGLEPRRVLGHGASSLPASRRRCSGAVSTASGRVCWAPSPGTIAGLTLIGFANVHSLWVFYGFAALSGISGFGAPSGQLLTTVPVAKWFIANRGRALAIATVGLPLGTAILIPVTQLLIDNIGWRETWAIGGVFVMSLTVPACLIFLRKDPESMGLHADGIDPSAQIREGLVERDALVTDEDWTVRQVLHNHTMDHPSRPWR